MATGMPKALGLAPYHRLLRFRMRRAGSFGLAPSSTFDDGNYFGVDAFAPYIAAGRRLAEIAGIAKDFKLLVSRDFEFERFGVEFDFGNAQSVFTHLSGAECDRCVAALRLTMKPGGVFFFTYLIGAPATQGMLYVGAQPMRRFAMTDPDFFAKLALRHSIRFEPVPISHPTGQQVAVFRF